MQQTNIFKILFLLMAATIVIITAISFTTLYQATTDQYTQRLTEIVHDRARILTSQDEIEGHRSASTTGPEQSKSLLENITEVDQSLWHFGKTGVFVLAHQEANQIKFIYVDTGMGKWQHSRIPFQGQWAQPMRRALNGESGAMNGLDYRGVQVLAAYLPLPMIDAGLVAKIDMSEIRQPFVDSGLVSAWVAIFLVLTASIIFFRLAKPIQQSLERQAETFKTLAETTREGIILAKTDGTITFANVAAENIFGYTKDELLGQRLNCLMPPEHSTRHDAHLQTYLETGVARIIGIGRQLNAVRKDGTRFPIYLSIGDIKLSNTRLLAGVIMDISDQRQLQREILEISVSEQQRIGQELHDGLGQQLTGLGMLASSLLNKAGKPEHELAEKLAIGLRDSVAQVRALSRGLIPIDIDHSGLVNALRSLIDDIYLQSNVAIKLTIDENIEITDQSIKLHLFRITQEAINNAIKHADATDIQVSIAQQDNLIQLTIRDDGKGMNKTADKSPGLGLRIMKHRCSLIDAELEVNSSDQGTLVVCRFPFHVRSEHDG